MTPPGLFDADELQRIFQAVNNELASIGPKSQTRLVVVGGAAISLRSGDRTTRDLDVISDNMGPEVFTAAHRVAREWGLPNDWLNDAAKGFAPNLPLEGTQVYEGSNLAVTIPSERYLLAMKLFSARDRDLPDAELLARHTGLTTTNELLELVTSAYAPRPINVKVRYFAEQVAANSNPSHRTRPDPERLSPTPPPRPERPHRPPPPSPEGPGPKPS